MKKLTLLLIAVLLTTSFTKLQAQSKFKQSKFSISIQGGAFLPVGDESDEYNIGGNIGLGLNYKFNSTIEIYAEGNHNFSKNKIITKYYGVTISYNGKPSIFDAGIGVRFIFGQSRFKTFIEVGPGIYIFNISASTFTYYFYNPKSGETTYNTYTNESHNYSNVGTHIGLGEMFNVSKNIDLYLRGDFRSALSGGDKGITSFEFFGVYAGAKLSF
jgi:hypothetical protein